MCAPFLTENFIQTEEESACHQILSSGFYTYIFYTQKQFFVFKKKNILLSLEEAASADLLMIHHIFWNIIEYRKSADVFCYMLY